eukprot:c40221_g1_i1.p1 GENE.c40221_g1_i1~~c40221_g1_i1.p1  ORF type:complete len:550 (+),score=109.74 c40221_g1_i1:31-1650(+)
MDTQDVPALTKQSEEFDLMRERARLTNLNSKLVIVLVGLPGRGKSYVSRKLQHLLSWKGLEVKIYNVSSYRREVLGIWNADDAERFSGSSPESTILRNETAQLAMDDMVAWLDSQQLPSVAIFDSSGNGSQKRRQLILDKIEASFGKGKAPVLFIETECTDEQVLNSNLLHKAEKAATFANISMETALERLRQRIANEVYEPITDDNLSYIHTYNLSSKVLANKVYGPLNKSILSSLVAWNLSTRPIWLVRSGMAEGDRDSSNPPHANSLLAPQGEAFAKLLAQFVRTRCEHWANEVTLTSSDQKVRSLVASQTKISDQFENRKTKLARPVSVSSGLHNMDSPPQTLSHTTSVPSLDLLNGSKTPSPPSTPHAPACRIFTSTLARAQQTIAGGLSTLGTVTQLSQLNPLDKGNLTGKSTEEIQRCAPDWYDEWCSSPLDTRFPGGESYSDVMRKVEGVVIDLEKSTIPVVVVSHVTVLQVLLAYFKQVPIREACDLSVPMHSVIELSPQKDGTWQETLYSLFGENLDQEAEDGSKGTAL